MHGSQNENAGVESVVTAWTHGGATENARHDIARLDKSAPYRKGGHRETCFIVRVEAQYKLIFAAGSIIW